MIMNNETVFILRAGRSGFVFWQLKHIWYVRKTPWLPL